MDTRENMVLEEVLYQVAEKYFIRTETVIHTRAVRIPREENAEKILQVNSVVGARSGSNQPEEENYDWIPCLLYTSRCV